MLEITNSNFASPMGGQHKRTFKLKEYRRAIFDCYLNIVTQRCFIILADEVWG